MKQKDHAYYAWIIILTLQAILDIEKVVIGGGISAQPIVLERINYFYDKQRGYTPIVAETISPVEIESCQFGNKANLLGSIYQLLVEIDRNNALDR